MRAQFTRVLMFLAAVLGLLAPIAAPVAAQTTAPAGLAWHVENQANGSLYGPAPLGDRNAWVVGQVWTENASGAYRCFFAVEPGQQVWISGHRGGTAWYLYGTQADAEADLVKQASEVLDRDGPMTEYTVILPAQLSGCGLFTKSKPYVAGATSSSSGAAAATGATGAGGTSSVPAATSGTAKVTVAVATVRKGPGTTYGTNGRLTRGQSINVIATDNTSNPGYTWLQMAAEKWVRSDLTDYGGATAAAAGAGGTASAPAAVNNTAGGKFPGEAIGPAIYEYYDPGTGKCGVGFVKSGEKFLWQANGTWWGLGTDAALSARWLKHLAESAVPKDPACEVMVW